MASGLFSSHIKIGFLMNRMDVTEKIISTKVSKGIKWEEVAQKIGLSKE